MRHFKARPLGTVVCEYLPEMTLNFASSLNNDQKKWLDELVSTNQVKDLGIYIRSLKHLNDFASIESRQPLKQQFIDDFLYVYLSGLVSKKELKPTTAKSYYNISFRFLTWLTENSELKKQNLRQVFSNVESQNSGHDLNYNVFSERNVFTRFSIKFKLIFLIILREKQLSVEDVISLTVDRLELVQSYKLRSALRNYVFSSRCSLRLKKARNEPPHNKVYYSQRGELLSLDSFRSRLSDLNKFLKNNSIHITSKALRQFSITDEEACVPILGIINE